MFQKCRRVLELRLPEIKTKEAFYRQCCSNFMNESSNRTIANMAPLSFQIMLMCLPLLYIFLLQQRNTMKMEYNFCLCRLYYYLMRGQALNCCGMCLYPVHFRPYTKNNPPKKPYIACDEWNDPNSMKL